MGRSAFTFTFTGVGARQNCAAGEVGARCDAPVIALALCDGLLGSIAVHSSHSHRQILEQNLRSPQACDLAACDRVTCIRNLKEEHAHGPARVHAQARAQ